MKVSQEQFAVFLNDRLRMLARSCAAYDSGDFAEATRLAGSIVKLIGDRTRDNGSVKENFISLTTRLGVKPTEMVDGSIINVIDQPALHGPVCILGLGIAGATGMTPMLGGFKEFEGDPVRRSPFDHWWNTAVLRDRLGNEFSRRAIVEQMRDKEEAHSDDTFEVEYAQVAYRGAIGITQVGPVAVELDTNPARVVVRQVAYEVLQSLAQDVPRQFIDTRGVAPLPITLFEAAFKNKHGDLVPILDHGFAEVKLDLTSDAEVGGVWGRDLAPPDSTPIPGAPLPAADLVDDTIQIRLVFINASPYEIPVVQSMLAFK